MITIDNLKNLYDTEFKPKLNQIENLRITTKRNWIIAAIIGFITFVTYQIVTIYWVVIAIVISGIIGVIFFVIKGLKSYLKYRHEFKNQIVSKIVTLINPNYTYEPDKHIEQSHFTNSALFLTTPDRYNGDDLITGKIDKTDFEFSEIKADYKTESTKDGKKETEWHTIFNGIFFHADFNKNLEGRTFVLPDTAEKLLGKFGRKLQKINNRGQLVQLEDPRFEKEFVVYSSSQNEARYILTPVMMEAIVNIKKMYNHKIHISFIGQRVYCAISFNKQLFEPTVFKSPVNFNIVAQMYHILTLIETIVSQMKLNTRIWTKE